MTSCIVCHQVVIFAEQNQVFVFCSQHCYNKFLQEYEIEVKRDNHHSFIVPKPKLSDVAFKGTPFPEKKTGMFGQ